MKYIDALRTGLDEILKQNETAVLLGEDIAEPYGGAFKVTKGLEIKYPKRVIATPMSESALTGIAVGMALNGYKPILEIMFGDFVTLCADQLINHASKFKFLYGKNLNMVIRTPMGGYRGYGATHSQTMEKMYFGIPHIGIFAPNILLNPGELMKEALDYGSAVIFIENKTDYSKELVLNSSKFEIKINKTLKLIEVNIAGENKFDGYVVTYGGMTELALDIMWDMLMSEEKSLKLLIPYVVSPLNKGLLELIEENKEIYVLEEASKEGGFGSEIARLLLESGKKVKKFQIFSGENEVIGASRVLENYVLPDKARIIEQMVRG